MKRRCANHQKSEKKQKLEGIEEEIEETEQIPINEENENQISTLTEEQVGIKCYLSSTEAFTGIMKHKCSDFVVREIDRDGNIVCLTEFAKHKIKVEEDAEVMEVRKEEGLGKLMGIIPSDALKQLKELVEMTDVKKDTQPVVFPSNDKGVRTMIHTLLKEYFNCFISDSYREGDNTIVRIRRVGTKQATSKQTFDNRGNRQMWPKDRGDYLEFTLHKFNTDTMTAINMLANGMHCKPKLFSFCGTKDKRAVTTQRITAYRVTEEHLAYGNKSCSNLSVGNCRFVTEQLELGQNKGNYFTIILRNVTINDDVWKTALDSIKVNGFVNYFGLQRFGQTEASTFLVGKYLVKEDFESACKLLLRPNEHGISDVDKAKQLYLETGDARAALQILPRNSSCYIERNLLEGLKEYPEGYANAFDKLNTKMKTLYLHALQSYIWNHLATYRLENFPHAITPGDLILVEKKPVIVTDKYLSEHPELSLIDVVIPLPGGDVSIPSIFDPIYEKLLTELELNKFIWLSAKQKVYHLSGSYRNLIEKPKRIEAELKYYNDPDDILYETDVNKLTGKTLTLTPGPYKALQISFDLSSGSYATMFLREFMKCNTQTSEQMKQSMEHQ